MREMAKSTAHPPRSISINVMVGNKPSFVDREAFLTKIGPTEVGYPTCEKNQGGKTIDKKRRKGIHPGLKVVNCSQ